MSNSHVLFRPTSGGADEATMIAAAIDCIDAFTGRFNARDVVGMDALLHFPHVILSGEQLVIWNESGNLPASFFDDLHRDTGWVETKYQRKEVVLVSPRKVHLLVEYTRNRADDVRRQGFSDFSGCFVAEALVRFLFEFRRPRLGAATGVFGLSVS